MIGMTMCNCPQAARGTNDFSPCACCSSGEHRDPRCAVRTNSRAWELGITELALVEPTTVAHSRGKGRSYPPKWARRDRS